VIGCPEKCLSILRFLLVSKRFLLAHAHFRARSYLMNEVRSLNVRTTRLQDLLIFI
jgi:hypothetical protein